MTRRLLSSASLSKVLAWIITSVVLPAAFFAVNAGMTKLEALAETVQNQALEQAELAGVVDRLEERIQANVGTLTERNSQRVDDIAELKSDVRELTIQTQRLAIAVERLTIQQGRQQYRQQQ